MKIELELKQIITEEVEDLAKEGEIDLKENIKVVVERPKIDTQGDYSTNVAMVAASKFRKKPRELAEALKEKIEKRGGNIEKVEIAGPGFINFFLKRGRYLEILRDVFNEKELYGHVDTGKGIRVMVEFVSANPTGPLHVGHGRGAIYGDALANIMTAAGYSVSREYYLNDTGNQMATLGRSVYLRLAGLKGEEIVFPEECYQGGYINDIASEIKGSGDFKKVEKMSEAEAVSFCGDYAAAKIFAEIKEDLRDCGVTHDIYFSEKSLHEKNEVEETIVRLKQKGYAFENEGALWFKSTDFGDEKDRVLKKSTGEYTYFAADIAYHLDKFERGYERLIDVWGADHGGHVEKMKGAMASLGYNPDNLDLVLIQLVNLIRKGEMVSMSTRAAQYETLRSLIDDVGKDVCRYFFLMRSHNAQLDFDLELAKKQSPDNPVYYIQYAHARIASIFRKAKEEANIELDPDTINLSELDLDEEIRLAKFLGSYPGVIDEAARGLEPHKVSFYLLELARMFQSYYSKAKKDERYKVISGGVERIQTKLYLLKNIQIVLKNGLQLLGINAPEEMLREETDD